MVRTCWVKRQSQGVFKLGPGHPHYTRHAQKAASATVLLIGLGTSCSRGYFAQDHNAVLAYKLLVPDALTLATWHGEHRGSEPAATSLLHTLHLHQPSLPRILCLLVRIHQRAPGLVMQQRLKHRDIVV
eukprot:CAMPEP_0202383290 /NCGR_PEP_ID=MMETSP1127-20130417/48315_1 /ASSEMBLY_ACC=CAM_ASM_000462 /TAXON_ID=3047 /ORGANISM="Dunaliella tertiolecta, Strain CCMP1320" /LENGTH=128 /DNA_ID=CAMNT_0048982739 /DNA_START=894 /DNA_END=1277 /DNA_ORIENTATION=+